MIEAYSLYSGSTGNAYLIKSGNTAILVDAGRSSAALCRAIRCAGSTPEDISAVLITHEHSDHISALRVFHKKYHPLLIGASPVLAAVCENEGMCDRARALPNDREFAVGDIVVASCSTPHDSRANVCYRFRTAKGDTLAIATDMGEVTDSCADFLSGTECVIIESNHDPYMLKCGPYPVWLKSRIESGFGHLSNGQCGEITVKLARSGTKGFVLAHLSRENNTPELAMETVGGSLAEAGFGKLPLVCAGENHIVRAAVDGGCCEICRFENKASMNRR